MENIPLFQARNKHSHSGQPPSIDANTPNQYHYYFENAQGEQLIFVYDRETDTGTLYHGDLGWDQPQTVEEGKAPRVVMDRAETLWLQACWMAATEFKKYKKE